MLHALHFSINFRERDFVGNVDETIPARQSNSILFSDSENGRKFELQKKLNNLICMPNFFSASERQRVKNSEECSSKILISNFHFQMWKYFYFPSHCFFVCAVVVKVSKFQCFNSVASKKILLSPPTNTRHYLYKFSFLFHHIFVEAFFHLHPPPVVEMNNKLCFHGAHMSQQNQVSLYFLLYLEHIKYSAKL